MVGSKKRQVNHLCPNCLSKLILENGDYVCSRDRLEIWKLEFKKFDEMDLKEKKEYLDNIVDQDRFFQMYRQRDNLTCDFSTYRSPIVPSYSETIPDPIVVGRIERSLSRDLTEEELEEGYKFYRKDKDFKVKPTYGYNEFRIPRINFPEEV